MILNPLPEKLEVCLQHLQKRVYVRRGTVDVPRHLVREILFRAGGKLPKADRHGVHRACAAVYDPYPDPGVNVSVGGGLDLGQAAPFQRDIADSAKTHGAGILPAHSILEGLPIFKLHGTSHTWTFERFLSQTRRLFFTGEGQAVMKEPGADYAAFCRRDSDGLEFRSPIVSELRLHLLDEGLQLIFCQFTGELQMVQTLKGAAWILARIFDSSALFSGREKRIMRSSL